MRAAEAEALFDRNAASYDRVNRVISLGLDRRWRRWVVKEAVGERGVALLDVMAGTGEVAVDAALHGARVTAADVSPKMLARAVAAAREEGVSIETLLVDVSAEGALPDAAFDSVVISFGLRYAEDKSALLCLLRRTLRPEGTLVLLEFCDAHRGPLAAVAGLYFFHVLPRLAALLGEGPDLYKVLAESTRKMGVAEDVIRLAEKAGFKVRKRRDMGFGLVLGLVLEPSGDND